jgi:hypothetical protein
VRINRALQISFTDFDGRSCCRGGYPNKIGEVIRYAAGHFLGEEYAIRHARITRIGAPSTPRIPHSRSAPSRAVIDRPPRKRLVQEVPFMTFASVVEMSL